MTCLIEICATPGTLAGMAKARSKRSGATQARSDAPPISLRWAILIPTTTAIILNLPRILLGYFWDDFLFLTGRGHGGPAVFLVPDPGVAFYRPLSQGIYFTVLKALDPTSGLLGHVINLIGLAVAIALLVLLVSDLAGRRAGLMAGLVFACYGHVASLVTWISCDQDLFAILLVLAAFWLRNRGRDVASVVCAIAAVLCKEPAIAAFPVLIAWDWILGRPTKRFAVRLLTYAVVIAWWAAIHPGIHLLAGRGFQTGAAGYVGFENPERWGTYLLRYVMTLLNLPPIGFTTPWPDDLSIVGTLALAALLAGLLFLDRGPVLASRFSPQSTDPRRVAWIGLLFCAPALLMPTLLVRHWAPYFACLPAVGVAIAAGPWLARWSRPIVVMIFSVFLLFGVWCRGIVAPGEPVWSESVLVGASRAAVRVHENFKTVFPSFPRGSQIVVATASTGVRGINGTLIDNQALQVWYRDPTLHTVTTLNREPGVAAEFLVRITTDLEVIAIDPKTGEIRSSGGGQPDWAEVGRPLRNYAREVAADGDTDGGIRTLDVLSKLEPPEARPYNRRLVAMMLLAAGRRDEASALLAATPEYPRSDALGLVRRLVAEASSSEKLDHAAFEAFGLSANDSETVRWVMREFRNEGAMAQAAWWAGALLRLVPNDPEARAITEGAANAGRTPSRLPS